MRKHIRKLRGAFFAGLLALGLQIPPESAMAQTARGYVLNPSGRDTTRVVEPKGMSWLRPARRRSPTGFLYPYPYEPDTLHPLSENLQGGIWLDVGGMATTGDDDETRFWRYADWGKNFLLDSFRMSLLETKAGVYAEARGGGVGRDDGFYSAELSWLGRLRVRGSWSGIPRDYARDARSLYEGVGSDRLTLLPGLTPGGDPLESPFSQGTLTDAELVTALDGVNESILSVQRDEGRIQVDAWLRPDTRFFAHYRVQRRDGERPFGGSWLYPTDGTSARAVETVEPIDDRTHEISTGLSLALDHGFDANVSYSGSFYRNQNESLTWDNPFLVSGFIPSLNRRQVQRGRHALSPDNDWHNVKADLVVPLPLNGRLATTASWSRMRQDEDLLPPTLNSGILGPLDLDDWNSLSALPRRSADTEVETLLLRGDLLLRPWKRIRLGARVRYFDRDNKSDYTACNPATGEAGYVTEDGALASLAGFGGHQLESSICGGASVAGPVFMEDFRYRASPYGYDQLEAEGRIDARLYPKTSLALRYAWERKGYDHRERDHTTEQRVRAEFSSRQLRWATTRISYEYADRDGSTYHFDPYPDAYASSLPEYNGATSAFTLAQFRKYDLADRSMQRADLRVNFLLREDMDLSVSGQLRDVDYGADYGLQQERGGGLHVEWNWQPSPDWNAYLMGSWERAHRDLSSIAGNFGFTDPNAGGNAYPLTNRWEIQSRQDTSFAGAGLSGRLFERWIVEVAYRFVTTRQKIDYDYDSVGMNSPALTPSNATQADAGSAFPDLETTNHILENSIRFEATEHLALRFFHIYQRGGIEDFQQTGLDDPTLVNDQFYGNPLGAGTLFLGHVDRDYTVHVFGATVQLRY